MAGGKKLVKSQDKLISGAIGGIADYFGWDHTITRIVYAVLTVCTAFCGVLIYLIMWIIIPKN